MPLIDEMLDQPSEAKYLSKLDLNKGFYQIPVFEKIKKKWHFFHYGENTILTYALRTKKCPINFPAYAERGT